MQTIDELYTEAPIVKHTTDLYREFYECLKMFPKKDQFLLGKRCEELILAFLELILTATTMSREQKGVVLQKAAIKFDVLKLFLRIARELKILDNKKYLSLQAKIQEIGKMLGGWIRSLQTAKAP
ncbi:MAG: diversity-generating retroelement protein Avd [Candidatus Vogelbacteria bacterium]|nr:diversity-generating retroelement protein Avd [Candidatus Vogelbacteria bacterium]